MRFNHWIYAVVLSSLFAAGADDGIEEIRAAGLVLTCLQTVTGIKFVITAEPNITVDLREVLKEIYVLYTECVLKDPFYELEMPIRSDLFVQAVDAAIQRYSAKMIANHNIRHR
jgi:trafficking protein particle complex subunit 4